MKKKFPQDAHDIVMLVRTGIEFIVFNVFIVFSSKIIWLHGFSQLNGLRVGVSASLFYSLIILIITVRARIKDKPIRIITYFESVADAVFIIWLIFIFGGMNGPFFFFFFLAVMEAAFTFSLPAVLIVIAMGILSTIGDYGFQIYITHSALNIASLFFVFFRIVTISLIGYYSYSFMNSVIKEQKTAKELRVAYEELQKLDQAKSEFISITSHQLRTPLTAIKGYVSMILDGNYGEVSNKISAKLKNVYQSNERLIKLINNLLSVSRIETGKMELNLQKINLDHIISEAYDVLIQEAKKKKIYLKWEKNPTPDIMIDEDKIRQVLINVLDNAVKYTETGGVTIKTKKTNNSVLVEISDTGVGLIKEEKDKLFQSFSRGSAGSRFHTEGIGIGLYIAKKFVDLHQGKIWAESEGKDNGSAFYIELPIKQSLIIY
ncbi:MAG: HAMP domain-containing sensor histidine kinase [Candidatus Pacebacteria bacterium]|nr:HAMP domain-containing sensor histidine kinase [Candidatus Paceibacterota bacterium]